MCPEWETNESVQEIDVKKRMWIEDALLVQCFPLKVNRNRTSQKGVQALKQYGPEPNLGNEEKETHAEGQVRDWWE